MSAADSPIPSSPRPAVWPSWCTLLRRGWRAVRVEQIVKADDPPPRAREETLSSEACQPWRPAARLSCAPSPSQVLPQLPYRDFRIQCIPLHPAERLKEQMQDECASQTTAGMSLVTTFTYDGDLFLIFKRAEWNILASAPALAELKPEAAGAERRAGGF